MFYFPPTIILRHRKENLNKCSLKGLQRRPDLIFFTYPLKQSLPPLENYCMLTLNAPPLTLYDAERGILIIDGTWRYADKMIRQLPTKQIDKRSLPSYFRTAYPRRQQDCPDPEKGLASIEALYLSYVILQRNTEGLLDHYYWKTLFLKINQLDFSLRNLLS